MIELQSSMPPRNTATSLSTNMASIIGKDAETTGNVCP
jgi:hypothetical protein